MLPLLHSVRGNGSISSASSGQPNSMEINSAPPLLCYPSTSYFPFCLVHFSLTSSQAMDVRKETLSLPWWSGALPWGLKCLSGAGPSNPNTAAPEPRLSTLGTHLLVMLPHRFSGVTGAEWGPLCPTQVTEETAAITQISLSHSNYLTALASRHVFSCSPRALESSSTERCKAVFCRNENYSLHLYGSTYYISKHRET